MLILERNEYMNNSTSKPKILCINKKECIKSIYKDIERSPRYLSAKKVWE